MEHTVDINTYFGSWPYWKIENGEPEKMIAYAAKCGIDELWVSSLRAVLLDWVDGNEETFRICSKDPERLFPLITVSPFWVDNVLEMLEEYVARGMCGLRLIPTFQGYSVGEYEEFLAPLEWASDRQLPIVYSMRLFMNWGMRAGSIADVEVIAAHAPHSPIILSGVNWGEIMEALTLVERFQNLYFDVSCLALRRGLELLVQKAGKDRVLFGSALPFQDPSPILAHIRSLPVSAATVKRILGSNAKSLLMK